jgi:hypothetical protein
MKSSSRRCSKPSARGRSFWPPTWTSSTAVGAFYRRGLGITEWNERLRFLNRGQQWVADRLAAVLPRLPDSNARRLLEAMYQSHVENIALCQSQMPSS